MKNIELKPTFLLSKAVIIPNELQRESGTNTCNEKQSDQNWINSINLGTQSKTFAAPGDDDPDWEAETCF